MARRGLHSTFLNNFNSAISDFIDEKGKPAKSFATPPDWDEYFYALAKAVSLRSKDGSRKVGAVVVGEGNVVRATGFNGFPRGVKEFGRIEEKDEKYLWITHAEANAIFNAARSGVTLVECVLYTTTFPCSSCAQAIVQAGIKDVRSCGDYWLNDKSWENALDIFAEARVRIDAPVARDSDRRLRALVRNEPSSIAPSGEPVAAARQKPAAFKTAAASGKRGVGARPSAKRSRTRPKR